MSSPPNALSRRRSGSSSSPPWAATPRSPWTCSGAPSSTPRRWTSAGELVAPPRERRGGGHRHLGVAGRDGPARSSPRFVAAQPPWSDLPFLVFGAVAGAAETSEALALAELAVARATSSLLERPIRVVTLLSAVETALRARRRQYAMRDLLARVEDEDPPARPVPGHARPRAAQPAGRRPHRGRGDRPRDHDEPIPPAQIVARQAAAIRRQGGVLTRLVDDLLDVARVTSGKVPLRKRPRRLRGDRPARRRIGRAARVAEKGVEVRVPVDASPVWVSGDATRLEQVVSNLLTNAIKYTPAGGRVDVTLTADGGEAVLALRDTGVGIEPELLPRIFDLFKQADRTLVRAEGGLGIGLTLVRTLVELHGGTVVARERRAGPRQRVRGPPPAGRPRRARGAHAFRGRRCRGATGGRGSSWSRTTRTTARRWWRCSSSIGCAVEFAADGEEGARGIVERRPEVAIVDIGLPGMDGYAVAQHVRDALQQDIVLVALTGYGQPRDREMALPAGFDVHLRKPVDVNQLRALVAGAQARSAEADRGR